MEITGKASLDHIIMVGDRVLVRPVKGSNKTKSGLYLPPGVKEKEDIRSGFVIKVGPGYPIPMMLDGEDEPWKDKQEQVKFVPLQPKEGDQAVFLQRHAFEIEFQSEKYFIVPHSAILMLIRDESIFE